MQDLIPFFFWCWFSVLECFHFSHKLVQFLLIIFYCLHMKASLIDSVCLNGISVSCKIAVTVLLVFSFVYISSELMLHKK